MLVASIDAMERVETPWMSSASTSVTTKMPASSYSASLLRGPAFLRDLLSLSIWEDYGLFYEFGPFLRILTEPQAPLN